MFPKALVAVLFGFGCIPADQGGGGGLGAFTRGFAFVRSGNIFLADQSNYSATPIQLTTNGGNRHPSLSADGRRVVFVHATNEIDIVSASTGSPALTRRYSPITKLTNEGHIPTRGSYCCLFSAANLTDGVSVPFRPERHIEVPLLWRDIPATENG